MKQTFDENFMADLEVELRGEELQQQKEEREVEYREMDQLPAEGNVY